MTQQSPETKIIAIKQQVTDKKAPKKSRFMVWALPVSLLIHGMIWATADGLKGKEKPKDPIQMVFRVIESTPKPPKIEPKIEPKPEKQEKVVPKKKVPPPVKKVEKPKPPEVEKAPEPKAVAKTKPAVKKPPKKVRKIRARARKGLRVPDHKRVGHNKHKRVKRKPTRKRRAHRTTKGKVARKPKPVIGRADKGKEIQDRVWQCGHEGREKVLAIHRERDLSEWIKVVPTVLAPFSAQTDIMEYLEGVTQVQHRRQDGLKRLAPFEMALPNEVLVLDIEAPVKMQAALGFLDARCLIGFSYTRKELFPFTLHSVPMRFMDENGNMLKVVADAIFHRDARVELVQQSGDPLLFDEIKLENSDAIATNIDAHYAVAGVVKEVASFFGIDFWKKKKRGNKKKVRGNKKKDRAHLTAKAGR